MALVKEALEAKKEKEAGRLLAALKLLCVDVKVNPVYGDMNISKLAFLVTKEKERKFDQKISDLAKKYQPRKEIKYFGPVPPYNFVEVTITW